MANFHNAGQNSLSRWLTQTWGKVKNALAMPPEKGADYRLHRLRPLQQLEERCLLMPPPSARNFVSIHTLRVHSRRFYRIPRQWR